MKVLCTMPGKYGDIMWALPTVKAIAQHVEEKVDFVTSEPYHSLLPLIQEQFYIGSVAAFSDWQVQDTAPMTPAEAPPPPPDVYDHVFHLGHTEWPQLPLVRQHHANLVRQWPDALGPTPPLALEEPWIEAPKPDEGWEVVKPDVLICWSEEWCELKMGVTQAVDYGLYQEQHRTRVSLVRPKGSRYFEWPAGASIDHPDWVLTAQVMSHAQAVLCCLSSQWVLANALGKRCVVMEPAEARHNPIFWREHARNTLVTGIDGQPTFDARHVLDAVKEALDDR
jgi:hypothetical protein